MKQQQLNVHYIQYSAALIKNHQESTSCCTNDISVEDVQGLNDIKNLNKGSFHSFLRPPEVGLVRWIESSNSQRYRLHFNTITNRLLLLRQQAGIKAVPTGDSPGRFSGSLLWCFCCHHHHHWRHKDSCPLIHLQMSTHTQTHALFGYPLHWLLFIVDSLTKTLHLTLTMTNSCLTLTST